MSGYKGPGLACETFSMCVNRDASWFGARQTMTFSIPRDPPVEVGGKPYAYLACVSFIMPHLELGLHIRNHPWRQFWAPQFDARFVANGSSSDIRARAVEMKKLSSSQRERQIRTAIIRDWQRHRHRRHARRRKIRNIRRQFTAPVGAIEAPRRVDLIPGFDKALRRFLDAVAEKVLKREAPAILNFYETEGLALPGTILMFAELDRIAAQSSLQKPLTIIDPKRRRPREVLKQIRLHEITQDVCNTVPSREDVVYWKATKGRDVSGDRMAMIEAVADTVRSEHGVDVVLATLWRGVSEAVSNSVEHAYMKPRRDGFGGLPETKWWMFTQVKDGFFLVAVCDLGCGYRNTIGETIGEQIISQLSATFAGENQDARAIHTAMEYGRTGTAQRHRGKGSRDALSVLTQRQNGQLLSLA